MTASARRSDLLVPRGTAAQVEALLRARLEGTCDKLVAAGSFRRGYTKVHDLEFVAVPKMIERPRPGTMFDAETETVSALWVALDDMVESGNVAKALYPNGFETDPASGLPLPRPMTTRWGEKHRSIAYPLPPGEGRPESLTVEFFTVPARFFGLRLCERTGPQRFSQLMACRLKASGLQMKDGGLVSIDDGREIDCPTEKQLLSLAGMPWMEPAQRSDYWRSH